MVPWAGSAEQMLRRGKMCKEKVEARKAGRVLRLYCRSDMCERRKEWKKAWMRRILATAQFWEMFSQADGEPLSPMSCWEGPTCLHSPSCCRCLETKWHKCSASQGAVTGAISQLRSQQQEIWVAHFHYCHLWDQNNFDYFPNQI